MIENNPATFERTLCHGRLQVGLSRLCSATFQQLLAFGATFCGFNNLKQVLPFRAIFEQNDWFRAHVKHEKVNDFVENLNSCEFLEGLSCYQPFEHITCHLTTFRRPNWPIVTIANLAQELPLHLAASDGVTVTCEDDKLTWWANHKDTLPHLSSLVKFSF